MITPETRSPQEGATYATPQTFQRFPSETSESRKLGRPSSMPPLPDIDYKLPRTSVVSSRPQSSYDLQRPPVGQKATRKAIRTPSGRNMSASDYLRGGYKPSEKSLQEEQDDDGVQRFFVKLKN